MCPVCRGSSFRVTTFEDEAGMRWPALECAGCLHVSVTRSLSWVVSALVTRDDEERPTDPAPAIPEGRVPLWSTPAPLHRKGATSGTFELALTPKRRLGGR